MTASRIRLWTAGAAGVLLVVAALLLAMTAGVAIGEMTIPMKTTVAAVTNRLGLTEIAVPRIQEAVIWDYRLSRSLVAAFCGAGLALSGAILQSLLRNPLAEPYVLGISAGASTGAVSVMLLGFGAGAISLSAGAFAGALLAFAFVVMLVSGRQTADRTILAGVAASQLFNALTSYIVSTSANAEQARSVMFWLLGSFAGVRWPDVALSASVVSIGLVVCIWHSRALDAFTFGEDAARSLGIAVQRVRVVLLLVTALMTATMVSMVGAIGFVGLVIPHAARFIVGPGHMRLLPACALVGALFMVVADIVSRIIIAPQVLPIGVVTALVGVPFFSVILYRARRVA
ncbi:iron complex transport system permease protein [Rhizobium cellulosilyticum]|uniref:Iron complex transport system permease protein n=2 Tax=Hyphomicrobiales TaxID=356 RepID=A0A7W6SB35_9HYPH|nr:iron complex transport system permease protein [Rhizobium cellulosilyticum]MBB4413494.1 iron complex transport system permease protein [Rhizobium cellulosilyticum]MBB4448127.1 iron complex transport system permease protein [Rhizobium cellulosilyticum]